ncbi:MAG: DMT family transporter [Acetobacteraceae bacterium]
MSSRVAATRERLAASDAAPLLGLCVLVVIWGLSVPAMKLGLESLPPFTLVALRYVVAAPCFMLFLLGQPLPPRRLLLSMAGLGVVGVDLGQATQIVGLAHTSAALGTVITASIPLFTVLLAATKLRQTLLPRHIAGFLLALAGIACAVIDAPGGLAGGGLLGILLLLVASASIALYYVLGTAIALSTNALVVSAWSSLAAVPFLAGLSLFELRSAPFHPSFSGLGVVLYLGILTTVAGMWLWFTGMRRLPARIAASTQYLQPVIGVAASAALFGDRIGPLFGAGVAAVLGGVALASWPTRNQATKRCRR